MNGDIYNGKRRMWIGLCCGFLILGLAACNLPGTGADDPEPTLTGGASQEGEWGQQEQALKKGECPKVDSEYRLLYDHEVVLNSGDMGDVSFHFEWEEQQDASYMFWIGTDGKVRNAKMNVIDIEVSGWHTTPSKECPINYVQGRWMLIADIAGSCKEGILTLKVLTQYYNDKLTGSCGDPISVPGRTKAPELTLTFDLSDPDSTDGITSGSRGDLLHVLYWYKVRPAPNRD